MKKLAKRLVPAGALLVVILLAGCAPTATQYAPLPPNLSAAPEPGKARICLIRGYVFWIGSAGEHKIKEDGVPRGRLINGSYLCWERPPGVSQLSLYEGSNVYSRGNLPVEADLVYYLYLDALNLQFKSIPPAEGQKYLVEYPKPQVAEAFKHMPINYGQPSPAGATPAGASGAAQTIPPPGRVGY